MERKFETPWRRPQKHGKQTPTWIVPRTAEEQRNFDNFLSTYEEEEEEGNRSLIEKRKHWTNLTTRDNTLFSLLFFFFSFPRALNFYDQNLSKQNWTTERKKEKERKRRVMLLVGTESHIITHKKYTCLVMCVSSIYLLRLWNLLAKSGLQTSSSEISETKWASSGLQHHHRHHHHRSWNLRERERERERERRKGWIRVNNKKRQRKSMRRKVEDSLTTEDGDRDKWRCSRKRGGDGGGRRRRKQPQQRTSARTRHP